MAGEFQNARADFQLLRMSFNRRHKGVEGTNDRGKADQCGCLMRAELPRKQKPESAQKLSELASNYRRSNHSQRKRKGF